MSLVSQEVIDAVDMILAARSAMRKQRRYLYTRQWSIDVQSEIDSLEVGFYTLRMNILRSLSQGKQRTAIRRLRRLSTAN